MEPLSIIWLVFILCALHATVITLIHRQETLSFLGIPLMRHIDIDDSQGVLRAIRSVPQGGYVPGTPGAAPGGEPTHRPREATSLFIRR